MAKNSFLETDVKKVLVRLLRKKNYLTFININLRDYSVMNLFLMLMLLVEQSVSLGF